MGYKALHELEAKVRVVKHMAILCQWIHCSHKRRGERMAAMRVVIVGMLEEEKRDYWSEGMPQKLRMDFFRTCHEMANVELEYETHKLVKDRMWFVIDLCDMMVSKIADKMAVKVRVAEPMDLPALDLDDLPF